MHGARVHEAVLAAGDKVSGVTIHLVDSQYDHGPILAQREVPVHSDDDARKLAARVLEIEHRFYSEVLQRVAEGEIDLDSF